MPSYIDTKNSSQNFKFPKQSPLYRLMKIFRSGNVMRHHKQTSFTHKPVGVARAFFKNAYSFQSSEIPGYSSYSRFARYCLAGDTLIATTNEKGYMRIDEIVEQFNKGKTIHIFAYDKENDTVVCTPISKAWLTKQDEVWEVELDDGTIVRCTKDHPFMLRDGTYKPAQELQKNDALMPFARWEYKPYKTNSNGYRIIYAFDKKNTYEHKLVYENINNIVVDSSVYHIHHKDFNGLNNDISNLEMMTKEDHFKLHASLNERRWKTKEAHEQMSKLTLSRWSEGGDLRENIDQIQKKIQNSDGWKKSVDKLIDRNKTEKYGQYNKGRQDQKKEQNANAKKEITLDLIKKNYEPNMSIKKMAQKLGCDYKVILKRTRWMGYKGYPDFIQKEVDPNYKGSSHGSKKVTAQNIYCTYKKGMTQKEVADVLNVNSATILTNLKNQGYKNWNDFVQNYQNHKVSSVRNTRIVENVYDLTVPGYSNFALCSEDSRGKIFVHNSDYAEMESYPDLANALNVFADEVTQKNENGKIIEVVSDDQTTRKVLTELFEDILQLNGKKIWKLARNLCKYGDDFRMIDANEEHGVVGLIRMPANEVEREEGFDSKNPEAVRFRWTAKNNVEIPNAYIAHFRLDGNDLFHPYGTSTCEAARRPWRQLCISKGEFIWTNDGYKPIEEIKSGDLIYCYDDRKNELRKTKVVATKHMGKQKVVSVKTRHREIKVTPNHGLLVKNKDGIFEYKKAEDLVCSSGTSGWKSKQSDRLVLPFNDKGVKEFNIELDAKNYFAELKKPLIYNSTGIMNEIRSLNCSFSDKNIHAFLNAQKRVPYEDFVKLKNRFNISNENINFYYKGSKNISSFEDLTFKVTKDFCRFFGFMLGDGWVNKNNIGFALGEYPEQNEYYINLVNNLFAKNFAINSKEGTKSSQVAVYGAEISRLFEQLEFRTGFKNKRIPNWCFKLDPECKYELLKGYFDADGSGNNGVLSSSNKDLLEDARILAQQCGIEVGKKVIIDRKEGTYFDKSFNKEIYRQESYKLWMNFNKIQKETVFENVLSVQEISEEETYDLQVEDEVHNFICEGIVSHNTLLEDSMLVYRISRGPERRVFYLDIGGIPANEAEVAVNEFNKKIKKNKVVNDKGVIDLRYASTMEMTEDFVIPVRGNNTSTRIETLPGGQNINDIDDVQFIQSKLFAALGIPRAFLTYDDGIGSKQVLTHEDIRFARTVARVQECIISELIKIAMIHLYILGKRGKELINFKIKMTNPSVVSELQKNELWRARMELVQAAGEGVFDTEFIYKNFLHLSDEAIDSIRRGQVRDKLFQAKLMQIEGTAGMMQGAPGMGQLGGGLPGMGGSPLDMGAAAGGGFPGMDQSMPSGQPDLGTQPPIPQTPMEAGFGEAINPTFGKDLSRSSDGNSRTATSRGIDNIDMSEEDDWFDDDPTGMKDIRKSVTGDLLSTEQKENGEKKVYNEVIEKSLNILNEMFYEAYPAFRPVLVKANIDSNLLKELEFFFGSKERTARSKAIITESLIAGSEKNDAADDSDNKKEEKDSSFDSKLEYLQKKYTKLLE